MLMSYCVLGHRGFRLFLFPVMVYYYLFRVEARNASKQYLRHVAEFLPSARQSKLSSFRHFMAFGEMLLDKLLAWMGKITRRDVVFETPDVISEFESNRAGGVIIVSHLGNFEVCSALASDLPHLKLTVLLYTRHAEKFNQVLSQFGGKAEVEVMQVTEISPVTAMLLAQRVRAGEYIVIAGDRTPPSGGGRVTSAHFLGRNASFPQGPFILAGLLKCPVYLMFCLKLQGQYHLYIEHFASRLKMDNRASRQKALEEAVRKYARRLEHYCVMAPLQWFNFFPYWTDTEGQRDNPIYHSGRDRGAS
ncbi:MAG TPA: glycosyl transferase [Pseudomonadales bacterium]|nr:glycosyl transferase [Pseudomonadales bacterium]